MAALPTLLVAGDGTSPRSWTNQNYANIAEGISAADAATISHAPAKDLTVDTSFTLDAMPSDFDTMEALSWQVRFSLATITDDTYYLDIRIMSGATELARGSSATVWERVATVTADRSMSNTSTTAFTYLNTTASKTLWDAATLEIRIVNVGNKAGDAATVAVDTLEFTGTYVVTAAATGTVMGSLMRIAGGI